MMDQKKWNNQTPFTPGISYIPAELFKKYPEEALFYEACDQIAADTGTSREDVVFHILCSTYKNALSMIMAKGWVS